MENLHYEYDMAKADWLIKNGCREFIIGSGTGGKGDAYILFKTSKIFWSLYGLYKPYVGFQK